jgi:hypothetical protein
MAVYNDVQPDTPRNRGNLDAPHVSPVTPAEDIRTIMLNRASWGAILCGVVTAFACQVILNLIGIGVGVFSVDSLSNAAMPTVNLSTGAAIWWVVSGIISAFIGGLAAGRMAGEPRESTAGWHGFLSWGASIMLVSLFTAAAAGMLLGANGNGRNVNATQTAGAAAGTGSPTSQYLTSGTVVGIGDMTTLSPDTIIALHNLLTADPARVDNVRIDAIQRYAQDRGITVDEARANVQQFEQQYRPAATVSNANTSDLVSYGALTAAATMILGAIAALVGGRVGAVQPTITANVPNRPIIH